MLSEDADGEDIHTLTNHNHYVKAFEYKKEREELAKCTLLLPSLLLKCSLVCDSEEKYGSDAEDDESEDSEEAESEDEDGEELTPAVDAAILRTWPGSNVKTQKYTRRRKVFLKV